MTGMSWDRTLAQQRAIAFADDPGRENGGDSNDDLLKMIVAVYQDKKRPPLESDLPTKRSTIARRFGGFPIARQLAYELLTLAEQAEYKHRCPYCGRDNFVDLRGLGSHMRACKRRIIG